MSGHVRFGIIGFGNIGRTHFQTIQSDLVERASVSAVVTRHNDTLLDDVVVVPGYLPLFDGDLVDAVLVATPTMLHATIGLAALARDLHLVMEKPLAMSALAARRLVAAVPRGIQAVVMLNQRYHPAYRRIREIVRTGELGRIVRFNWVMTSWYRPDVYFAVSAWRGTWPGEGGGALLNQCIHNLDVLQWVLGMPTKVYADARFGKFHNIDVEDEVTAILSYEDGMSGVVVASTGEAPGINQFDIVGDRGTLRFDGESIAVMTSEQSVAEHCATTREMFGMPEFASRNETVGDSVNQHACILNNMVASVLDGAALETPLHAGLASLELANALLMSTWEERRVDLPVDADAYQTALDERIARSALRDPAQLDVTIDMDSSYR